ASGISSEAGYAGIGPNFLPLLVSAGLFLCGGFLFWESWSGGFRNGPDSDPSEASQAQPCWSGMLWMSAGLLLSAALITTIGFILSCALCFACAAHGLRKAVASSASSESPPHIRSWLIDVALGLAISAPVFWMFTKFLAISLPGLTQSGWL
ncbi:MAG: tripartite tricarboxylate transporter TctB family protein, partial [Comamonadaceae bacterium]